MVPNISQQINDSSQSEAIETASTRDSNSELIEFERMMAWTSFITGRVLRYDTDARNYFLNHLADGAEKISITDLISGNLIPANVFEAKFIEYLSSYLEIYIIGGRPSYGLDPPPGIPRDLNPGLITALGIFLTSITSENCLELYFPVGLNSLRRDPTFNITTTAHPLTNDSENEGVLRYYIRDPLTPLTELIRISDMNVSQYTNVIVARPFRPELLPIVHTCHYEDYSNINFEDFLD